MALKEIRKENAYPNNLPIRALPFAFYQLLWPSDSRPHKVDFSLFGIICVDVS